MQADAAGDRTGAQAHQREQHAERRRAPGTNRRTPAAARSARTGGSAPRSRASTKLRSGGTRSLPPRKCSAAYSRARRDDGGRDAGRACHRREQDAAEEVSSMNATTRPESDAAERSAAASSPSRPGLICRTSRPSSSATSGSISADARSPADAELTEELRARQAVAERLAVRQPEPARQHDQTDQRDAASRGGSSRDARARPRPVPTSSQAG